MPVTGIEASPPSLVITIAPLKLPLAFGANVTVKTRLLFGASVNLPPPDKLNGLPNLLVSTVPCNTPGPLFLIINLSLALLCSATALKSSSVVGTVSVADTPFPVTVTKLTISEWSGLLIETLMVPDNAGPSDFGAYFTVTVLVWVGAK